MAEANPPARRGRPPPENEIQTRPIKNGTLATKKGTSGTPVNLQANYFKLTSQPDWCLYQYRVDIAPEEERTIVRKALLKTHKARIGGYIFDGTVLYTSNPLPQPLELQSFRQEDKQAMKITVRLVGDLVKGDYHYSTISSILVRKTLEEHLKLQLVGRNYYDAASRIVIREFRLELWPGYVTSIRQHEQNVLMCAEISHKVMRDQTLLDILKEIYTKNQRNYQTIYQNEVLGCVVLTAYNNRTYRVDDVDFNMNPSRTFRLRDGTDISYATYYKQKYQIQIRDMQQPLLVSRSRMRDRRAGQDELVYLIPELCRSTGLTDAMRSDFRLMRALAEHTRVAPAARIDKLMSFNRRLKTQPEVVKDFKEWNFEIDNKLVELKGRVLPPEVILFGQNRTAKLKDDADWNFILQDHPQLRVANLTDWAAVIPTRNVGEAKTFIDKMIQAAKKIGLGMSRPRIIEIPDDRTDTYARELSRLTDTSKPQLVLCVVPNNQAMRYAVIKKKLCIDRPIPSQVMLARTLTQKSPTMYNAIGCKVATQLNCKVGGIPWSVQLSQYFPGMMIMGYDVCHDKRAKGSYGAMVASLDQNFGRYYSSVSLHGSGQEISNDVSIKLVRALEEFAKENNNKLPTVILFYRDGVGEGQLPFVHEHEVGQIKEKLKKIYGEKAFKFCFIVVTKRINTRFFLNKGNPKPGTVVDDVVTDPLKYDFFIVSQSVRQGTVAPTAYNVIEDCTGFAPDKIQLATFKLCHMYFNFSGTVRVPAPCQYAHKLAFFASQTLKQSPHPSLQKTLYFL